MSTMLCPRTYTYVPSTRNSDPDTRYLILCGRLGRGKFPVLYLDSACIDYVDRCVRNSGSIQQVYSHMGDDRG